MSSKGVMLGNIFKKLYWRNIFVNTGIIRAVESVVVVQNLYFLNLADLPVFILLPWIFCYMWLGAIFFTGSIYMKSERRVFIYAIFSSWGNIHVVQPESGQG